MNNNIFRSNTGSYIEDFINYKRSLGYKYDAAGQTLKNLENFLTEHHYDNVGLSKSIAESWAKKRANETELSRYGRLICMNQFSFYLRELGITSFILPLPKYPESTFVPHIFPFNEIERIFNACDSLRLSNANAGVALLIIPCLVRMLYATGIRVGEALALKNKDVDIANKCLIIEYAKNGKQRVVPFDDTLAEVCKEYIQYRDGLPVAKISATDSPFFTTLNGRRCKRDTVYAWFRKILDRAGILFIGDRKGPRVHDLRHSFACHAFLKMSTEEDMDLYCSWPYLSAYLGHQSLEATEKYIRLTEQTYPELFKNKNRVHVDVIPSIQNQK